jgi:phosphate/sulfate permease
MAMDFGFGDRLFVSVMLTFGLGFLWLGWLERYVTIFVVPLIGFAVALILIVPWYRKFRMEKRREREELERMGRETWERRMNE